MYEPTKAGEVSIRKLVNMALIIDAKNVFQHNMIGEDKFATNYLSEYDLNDVEQVIKYTIKLMRLLNFAIYKKGTKYNTKERVTYKQVNHNIFIFFYFWNK